MTFKARSADRRHAARFEVVGSLPCHATVLRRLVVRNLSCGGLLLESPVPLPASVQTIQLESSETTVRLKARVLRTSPSERNTFTVAMEFVDPEAALLAQLQRILAVEGDDA
jgi:hypothetical protein